MTWLHDLHTLAARFGWGVASDIAAMNVAQLWAFYVFLKSSIDGG